MSAGSGQPNGQPPGWGQIAATNAQRAAEEAHGAHRNTGRILQLLQSDGPPEEDPLSAMLEAQDDLLERQEQMSELLCEMRKEIGQIRTQMQAIMVGIGLD